MVVYDSKKWFRNLVNFWKSYTLQVILRFVIVNGLITLGIVLLFHHFEIKLGLDPSIFSLLGIVLSILLVFRTNTAYDRWWEGRKQWGALVNHTRSLAQLIHVILPQEDDSQRFIFARDISNFCIALKEHLRKGVKLEELIQLSEEELVHYKSKDHIPNQISLGIYSRVQKVYREGLMSDSDHLNVKTHIQALTDILGACERIKKTPIPFSYNVYLKVFVLLYCFLLPFGLIETFSFYSIPAVIIVTFAMVGVELMGEEIEDPFGLDCNDLPTGTLSHTIRDNVFEILEQDCDEKPDPQPKEYAKIF